uniref:Bursicon n=1 Tax=Aceria tosichella TaxID=561515 RepID=A0A6G1SAI1_9ACAR
MRKFIVIVVIVVISLLNIATKPSKCYHSTDGKSPLIADPVSVGVDGGFLVEANTKKEADNQLIESMGDVEFENILTMNKDQLTADYQPAACQLVQIVHVLKHPGCQSKAIASFACSGSCTSFVRTSTSNFWQHVRSCSCCQQTGSQEATFALDCPSLDPPYRKVKTYAPIECLCRSCTDLSREDIRPQELVEALVGELNKGG